MKYLKISLSIALILTMFRKTISQSTLDLELESVPLPPKDCGFIYDSIAEFEHTQTVDLNTLTYGMRWPHIFCLSEVLNEITSERIWLRARIGELDEIVKRMPAGETDRQWIPGPNGPKGPPGMVGATGDPGLIGDKGSSGDPGARGADGSPGKNGPEGPNGATGQTGIQGSTGFQGLPGPNGSPGSPGFIGAPGSIGPHGQFGQPGATGATGAPGPPA